MTRVLTLAVALLAAAILSGGAPAGQQAFPDVIQLPRGFQPEGIEVGKGTTFYVGSVANGAVYRGDLRTGRGSILVPGRPARPRPASSSTTGIGSGSPAPERARRTSTTPEPGRRSGRTRSRRRRHVHQRRRRDAHAAYFTDSRKAVLYQRPDRAGRRARRPHDDPARRRLRSSASGFNLNGIDATPQRQDAIAVQSNTGKLFRIDPATGVATADLARRRERSERRRDPAARARRSTSSRTS